MEKDKKLKIDEEFDWDDFEEYKDKIIDFVLCANVFVQEEVVSENGTVLARIDMDDRMEYEFLFNQPIVEAAMNLILLHSKDETLESGLKALAEKSEMNDAPALVGYMLVERMRQEEKSKQDNPGSNIKFIKSVESCTVDELIEVLEAFRGSKISIYGSGLPIYIHTYHNTDSDFEILLDEMNLEEI